MIISRWGGKLHLVGMRFFARSMSASVLEFCLILSLLFRRAKFLPFPTLSLPLRTGSYPFALVPPLPSLHLSKTKSHPIPPLTKHALIFLICNPRSQEYHTRTHIHTLTLILPTSSYTHPLHPSIHPLTHSHSSILILTTSTHLPKPETPKIRKARKSEKSENQKKK